MSCSPHCNSFGCKADFVWIIFVVGETRHVQVVEVTWRYLHCTAHKNLFPQHSACKQCLLQSESTCET